MSPRSRAHMAAGAKVTVEEAELGESEFDNVALMSAVDPTPTPKANPRPKSIEEGMKDPKRKEALMREFEAHVKNNTFQIVDKTNDMQLLRMLMIQTEKYDENGNVDRYKARMVANGSDQEQKYGKVTTFAPNISKEAFRLLLTYAVHHGYELVGWDVCEAFLIPRLRRGRKYYAWPPPGFWLLQGGRYSIQTWPSFGVTGSNLWPG